MHVPTRLVAAIIREVDSLFGDGGAGGAGEGAVQVPEDASGFEAWWFILCLILYNLCLRKTLASPRPYFVSASNIQGASVPSSKLKRRSDDDVVAPLWKLQNCIFLCMMKRFTITMFAKWTAALGGSHFLFVLHCCLGSALLCTCLAWCMEHKHGVMLTQYSPHSASLIRSQNSTH